MLMINNKNIADVEKGEREDLCLLFVGNLCQRILIVRTVCMLIRKKLKCKERKYIADLSVEHVLELSGIEIKCQIETQVFLLINIYPLKTQWVTPT